MEETVELLESKLCVYGLFLVTLIEQVHFQVNHSLSISLYHRVSSGNYKQNKVIKYHLALTGKFVIEIDKLIVMDLFQ